MRARSFSPPPPLFPHSNIPAAAVDRVFSPLPTRVTHSIPRCYPPPLRNPTSLLFVVVVVLRWPAIAAAFFSAPGRCVFWFFSPPPIFLFSPRSARRRPCCRFFSSCNKTAQLFLRLVATPQNFICGSVSLSLCHDHDRRRVTETSPSRTLRPSFLPPPLQPPPPPPPKLATVDPRKKETLARARTHEQAPRGTDNDRPLDYK
jgi:hypothetical protein